VAAGGGYRSAFGAGTGLSAVVTDIDGTLTGPDRVLDPGASELLRRLSASGTPVVLATGNVLPIALAIHRSIGLRAPIVAENGGLVYFPGDGRDRIERLADRRVAWRAFRAARATGLPLRRLFTDRWRETEVALDPSVPVPLIRRAVRGHPVRVEGTGFAVHLMERRAGKAAAVDRVLTELGLSWSACLIAGDADNDVDMLRRAGWAVSFPNASPRARRAADYVTRASNGRGLVEAVKERAAVGRRGSG
jgi:phosphoglycolate phosphatase